jgi:hypothetical protein
MTREATSALALGLLCVSLAGCLGDSRRDSRGIERVETIAIYSNNGRTLNGAGDVIALEFDDEYAGYRETLQVYRQDVARPEALVSVGTVNLGGDGSNEFVEDLTLTGDWATVAIRNALADDGRAAFVSLTGPAAALETAVAMPFSVRRAVASGRWGVIAGTAELALVDLSTASAPVVVQTFASSGDVMALLPVADGFLAFTSTGYGHLVVAPTPQWSEVVSTDVRQFAKAYADGTRAYVAGPSPSAGKARVARLDVALPGQPILTAATDADGLYVDFAYDGGGRYVLVTGGNAFDLDFSATQFEESAGALVPSASGDVQISRYGVTTVYARRGYLYVLSVVYPAGIAVYRLP